MDSSSCFHFVRCSCKMSSNFSLFSVRTLLYFDDNLCREVASEVVLKAEFVPDNSIESGAKLFNSPGCDIEFAVFGDFVG